MNPRELFILSLLAGIIICSIWAVIYPYIPRVTVWRIEIFPSIRIHLKARVLHLHHWFYYPLILIVSVFIDSTFLASTPVRGYLTGAIIKELFFPSRKRSTLPRKLIYQSSVDK